MRKVERIKPFLQEIEKCWMNVPDWRFGQLIVNVLATCKIDPFFIEEDEMLDVFKEFFRDDKDNKNNDINS